MRCFHFWRSWTFGGVLYGVWIAVTVSVALLVLTMALYRAVDIELKNRELVAQQVPAHIRLLQGGDHGR
jgi:hypothetical protein